MTSIAISSQKGGVGKTTLSINLAHAFARAGANTLLVDADPQGSVGLSLTRQSRLLNGFYDFLADPSLNVLGVCLTMVQADLAESREVAASLRQLLPPELVFQTQIPRDPLFVRASACGLPVGVLEEGAGALAVFDSLRAEIDAKLEHLERQRYSFGK